MKRAMVLAVGFIGCSNPCPDACAATYDREVECGFLLNAGDRQSVINECVQILQIRGTSDEVCATSLEGNDSFTCAQLAPLNCPSIPVANRGPGCR